MPEARKRQALPTRAACDDILLQQWPSLAKPVLAALLKALTTARQTCGGDTDDFLVLLVIALRTAEHADFQRLETELLTSGGAGAYPSLGTNVRSVADSLDMPRETARRKIRALIDRGWVAREAPGLVFTPVASKVMGPLRGALIEMARRNHDAVAAVLPPHDG